MEFYYGQDTLQYRPRPYSFDSHIRHLIIFFHKLQNHTIKEHLGILTKAYPFLPELQELSLQHILCLGIRLLA